MNPEQSDRQTNDSCFFREVMVALTCGHVALLSVIWFLCVINAPAGLEEEEEEQEENKTLFSMQLNR